jgi:putative addiction module antidote
MSSGTNTGTRCLKVRRIGNSLGVVLPREMLATLRVTEGDELFASQTPEGLTLTPYDPHFANVIETGRRYMRRYRNAMRELAKR